MKWPNWFPFRSHKFIKDAAHQWYTLAGTGPVFNDYTKDIEKLMVAFACPPLLKVIALQCDLFSQARVYVYKTGGKRKGKEVESDPAIDRLESPNYMQERSQWLWDFMFWNMLGNAYLNMQSDIVERDNAPMYWLEPHKIYWPQEIEKYKDKHPLSQSTLNEIGRLEIEYRYDDGTVRKIPLSKIIHVADLTGGTGNWWKGFSKLHALTKILSNYERGLDSKNINIRFAGKFLVAGTNDINDTKRTPMGEDEKKSIEDRIQNEKEVHAIKSMVEIRRFVDDIRAMPLDESMKADYFMIGTMYGIPRDVLEAYQSATYENQEKARAGHVAYTLDPKGQQLGAALAKYWKYDVGEARIRREIVFSWDHLPFVQVFEKDRIAVKMQQINAFNQMLNAGISADDANAFLDTNFTVDETKRQQRQQPRA